jgi:hypothetical protein
VRKDRTTIFLETLLKLMILIGLVYVAMVATSCSDNTYIAGYNKDLEEIHQQMFEVDSIIMTIQKDLDSTSMFFEKFYIDAQRINNGRN